MTLIVYLSHGITAKRPMGGHHCEYLEQLKDNYHQGDVFHISYLQEEIYLL